jgi:drug/metabolite transporter (DMT)-like permease
MLYLLSCIFCTVLLLLCFKYFALYRVPTFQAIVVNYITCTFIGIWRLWPLPPAAQVAQAPWLPFCLVLGILFVLTFYLIALAAQRVGVTATSVASKISLVIPVLVSLLVLQNNLKTYTFLNYVGMGIALVAIVLASLPAKKPDGPAERNNANLHSLALPFLIFFFSGIGDSLINYTNYYYLQPEEANYFTTFTFATSATGGTLFLLYQVLFKKLTMQWRSLGGGILLGIPNYFSIYFLLQSLSAFQNDGAFLYPIINIGIILSGMLAAMVLFKERLSGLNITGVAAAVVALLLLSYQEINQFLISMFVVR